MRDVILTTIVAVLVLMIFRAPVVGAYLWAWLSMMNPHKLTYGFAFSMPFAQVTALVTLLMVAAGRQRRGVPMNAVVGVLLAMLAWMGVTSVFAIAPSEVVIERIIFVAKIQLMLFVTWMLVQSAAQIRILIWVVTLSIAFFGIKGGVWTLLTGGGGRVWGPPGGLIEGNNELAVALVMCVPMLYFLHQTETNKWIRRFLVFSMVSCAFSILGSQSRGALLSLVAMAMFLGLKSKHRLRATLVFVVLVIGGIAFMPDSWVQRMDTMNSYQEDSSAMSRIWTWKTLWAVAVDRPLVGAGFAADSQAVFAKYAPQGPEWDIFVGQVFVAHSIYFQMLGEHGFVGLGLFLLLGITSWIKAGRVATKAEKIPELAGWIPILMRMLQVSLIGFAVGGAFLSLAYFDFPYYLIGYVVLCDALVRTAAKSAPSPSPASAAATAKLARQDR